MILILNWNGKKDTLECLASLAVAKKSPAFSTVVIDNGSTDDSVSVIRAAFPDIPILETGKNLGYAGGNNVGIRWALEKSFEWILLLNNDTVISPDIVEKFSLAAKSKPEGKIFGAKIYRADKPDTFDHFGGFWDPKMAEFVSPASKRVDDGSFEEMQRVDYVCGCALFMHRSVPETIGLMEESFFLLWEETDFCAQARRANFEIWTAPKAKLWHKVSASFTGGKPHTHYFWWRNRLLWIERNCQKKERWQLYREVLLPEMVRCFKLALLKTLQHIALRLLLQKSNPIRLEKLRRYRASCQGILHFFLGRFGNCPRSLQK